MYKILSLQIFCLGRANTESQIFYVKNKLFVTPVNLSKFTEENT